MSFLATATGVTKLLGGIGGLFGKKALKPGQNIISAANGARIAAEKYGFNPLTLLNSGTSGGAAGAGAGYAPLASLEILSDGLSDLNDEVSGDADRRRAAADLALDLARLEIDQLRGSRGVGSYGATGAGFGSASPLGRQAPPTIQENAVRTSVSVAGVKTNPDTGWSDAEDIEKRYGDVASWLYGVGVIGADAKETLPGVLPSLGAQAIDPNNPQSWPPRVQAREWGRLPDVWDAGVPGWFINGNPNSITYTPPKQQKAKP